MKVRRFRKISLRASLSLAFGFMVAMAATGIGVSSYFVAKNHFRSELSGHIEHLAHTAASLIDTETHMRITKAEDEEGPGYKKIKDYLKQIRTANPDVRFIYTMRKTDKGNVFIVDAEEDPEQMSHVGDVYEEENVTLNLALEKPGLYVEDEFTTDKWGTFQSGFAPIYDKKGRFEGILGIDIAANEIIATEAYIRNLILLCSLATLAFALVIGYFLARRIAFNIAGLVDEFKKIEELSVDGSNYLNSTISEIDHLIAAVDGMKKALRSFKKYVPSELVLELLKIRQEAKLGTTKVPLTVMFTDIANFTRISEGLAPEDLSRNMSAYLEVVASVIREKTGTVDKFIGDAVMAFWGAPNPCEDHAKRACEAALICRSRLDELNEKLEQQGFPKFHTRFGLNTGESIVGNMGTDSRMSFTAIGDPVNVASRNESLNKFYGTDILTSEGTYEAVKNDFEFRLIDQAIVKGKSVPTKIYQLMDRKGDSSQEKKKLLDQFNEAMSYYFDGQFEKSKAQFTMLSYATPGDQVVARAINRLDESIKNRDAGNGQGFIPRVMRHK